MHTWTGEFLDPPPSTYSLNHDSIGNRSKIVIFCEQYFYLHDRNALWLWPREKNVWAAKSVNFCFQLVLLWTIYTLHFCAQYGPFHHHLVVLYITLRWRFCGACISFKCVNSAPVLSLCGPKVPKTVKWEHHCEGVGARRYYFYWQTWHVAPVYAL